MAHGSKEIQRLKSIELFATAELSHRAIAKRLRVARSTIETWKKDPEYNQAILDRSVELLHESLPEIYKALAGRSKQGSERHIKILLEHMERLEDSKSRRTSLTFTWKEPTDAS